MDDIRTTRTFLSPSWNRSHMKAATTSIEPTRQPRDAPPVTTTTSSSSKQPRDPSSSSIHCNIAYLSSLVQHRNHFFFLPCHSGMTHCKISKTSFHLQSYLVKQVYTVCATCLIIPLLWCRTYSLESVLPLLTVLMLLACPAFQVLTQWNTFLDPISKISLRRFWFS